MFSVKLVIASYWRNLRHMHFQISSHNFLVTPLQVDVEAYAFADFRQSIEDATNVSNNIEFFIIVGRKNTTKIDKNN